jgi:hypothetical protein
MTLRNTCFISYRNPGHPAAAEALSAFHRELEAMLALYVPQRNVVGGAVSGGAFIDRHRLNPGDLLDPNLAHELCCSACMVVLYTPAYFDPDALYCAREYRAMLTLEARRDRLLSGDLRGKGLIIPVVIRGLDDLPAPLSARLFTSFDRELLRVADFRKQGIAARIQKIAEQVYLRYKALKQRSNEIDCSDFVLPDEHGTREWLRDNVSISRPPMPGTGSA